MFARHLSLSARKKTKESIKEKIIEKSKKQQSAILDYRTELLENTLRNENFDRPQYQHALRMLNTLNPDHKNVIEFGAGRGEFARLLREKGYNVFFTDINPENVKWAKDNGFNALHLDANEKLNQFTDQQFDGAIMLEVIEHIPKKTESIFFREVRRVLKKKGNLFLSTPNDHLMVKLFDPAWYFGHRHYNHKELRKIAEKERLQTKTYQISGAWWSILGLINMYVAKWVFGRRKFLENFFEEKELKESQSSGFMNLFMAFEKK